MAQERKSVERPRTLTIPLLRPAWRELAVQQWLLQAHARLQIQSALASRVRDYFSQIHGHITERDALIQQHLATRGSSGESTQRAGRLRSTVFNILDELAAEGTVTPPILNAALVEHGEPPLSINEAQGYIAYHNLRQK